MNVIETRKRYEAPRLAVHGKVAELTAGGSGHANEPSTGQKPRP